MSVTINSTIDPTTTRPPHTVTVPLPFPVNGQGTVEAVTTTEGGFSTCTCIGLSQICRPGCSTTGLQTALATVCERPEFTPGAWQFTLYCRGTASGCETPLTRRVQVSTTITYTPTGN